MGPYKGYLGIVEKCSISQGFNAVTVYGDSL